MKSAAIVSLITKDSLKLDAIVFGPDQAAVGFVFVHGLGSSAFSHTDVLPEGEAYVSLYINNRGHDGVTAVKRLKPETEKGYEWFPAGKAHEVFEECVHDIQAGVDYLKERGITKIYLVGHSTGCQKSVYYLSQTDKNDIAGSILICPMSDYAAATKQDDPQKLAAAIKHAREMIKHGDSGELIPSTIWPDAIDAQRFLSLYTPDSVEEIFTYGQPGKKPQLLQKVTAPLLILLAENDEYADRPIVEIADWFKDNVGHASVELIPGSLHSLTGKDDQIQSQISSWIAGLR
jgi:pimeloyl-ACP methyl ester carboxylesterase